MMHTGELFEGVRRGEFRIDFRVSHRAEHATDSRAPSRRVPASTRQFVTFCLDNPAKSWVSVARGCVTFRAHHGRHDCAACPTDTGSNRTREGKASYATSGTASDRLLHGGAASERDYQRNYCDNLHLIEPCHDETRFRNGSDPHTSGTNGLLFPPPPGGSGGRGTARAGGRGLIRPFPPKGEGTPANFYGLVNRGRGRTEGGRKERPPRLNLGRGPAIRLVDDFQ